VIRALGGRSREDTLGESRVYRLLFAGGWPAAASLPWQGERRKGLYAVTGGKGESVVKRRGGVCLYGGQRGQSSRRSENRQEEKGEDTKGRGKGEAKTKSASGSPDRI